MNGSSADHTIDNILLLLQSLSSQGLLIGLNIVHNHLFLFLLDGRVELLFVFINQQLDVYVFRDGRRYIRFVCSGRDYLCVGPVRRISSLSTLLFDVPLIVGACIDLVP